MADMLGTIVIAAGAYTAGLLTIKMREKIEYYQIRRTFDRREAISKSNYEKKALERLNSSSYKWLRDSHRFTKEEQIHFLRHAFSELGDTVDLFWTMFNLFDDELGDNVTSGNSDDLYQIELIDYGRSSDPTSLFAIVSDDPPKIERARHVAEEKYDEFLYEQYGSFGGDERHGKIEFCTEWSVEGIKSYDKCVKCGAENPGSLVDKDKGYTFITVICRKCGGHFKFIDVERLAIFSTDSSPELYMGN